MTLTSQKLDTLCTIMKSAIATLKIKASNMSKESAREYITLGMIHMGLHKDEILELIESDTELTKLFQ